ncbi:TSC22 domain family protein 1 [Holothuria leucospilota]|uniref:TSC22 domain family protein 1 n=1 Tax=Holothuria leucospilota TaxID=206669 RepID=A0A9Q1BPJ5_HOLLE|nr:TSC22 domain family protein 1 [Holothuria leucospilota]
MADGINTAHQYNGREERSDSGLRSDQESDAEGQVGTSSQNLKGSRPKRSAFQITSVVTKNKDNNHGADDIDSQDELEESRVEEASSSEILDVSNLSRASLNSDAERSFDDTVPCVSLPDRTAIPPDVGNTEDNASNDGAAEMNGNGPSRFRVVKVPNPEPVKRGRWTCKDFPSETNQGQMVQERAEPGKENVHSGNSSAASSVHYVPGENATDPSAGLSVDEKSSRKRSSVSRQTSLRKSSVLDDIKNMIAGDESKADAEESAASAGAIDNKIEQAMDIVKGHLLMAVREEVEVLKEQISELLDANEKLREENTRLRKEKGSSQSGSQLLQHMSTSAQESQYQGIPPNPATQMHTPSSYHQHSLPGQQQQQMPSSTSTGAPTEQPHYQQPPAHHHHPQAQSVESAAQPQYQHIPDTSVVDQTTYTHAIPSQPSTVTTNTEQYHQAPGQPLQEGQYPIQQQVTTTPSSLSKSLTRSLNQSQYQHGPPMGMPHASSDQGQYQAVQPHHQIGASQEHSQAVPPAGAIPHTQHGTTQPRIPHSQGERQGHL